MYDEFDDYSERDMGNAWDDDRYYDQDEDVELEDFEFSDEPDVDEMQEQNDFAHDDYPYDRECDFDMHSEGM